jgi:hypothetical protein
MSASLNLSDEAQSLARVPLFQRLEPHELEHLAEDVERLITRPARLFFMNMTPATPCTLSRKARSGSG